MKKGTEPATVQRFEGWAIYGLDSRLRTTESGTTMGEPVHGRDPNKRNAWDALSHVQDQQGVLRMGSHRREAPSPWGQSNGPGTQ